MITLRCRVDGAAVAYAAQLSRAGYVPVSLRAAPERETRSWIQYLTPAAQLEAIAESEGQAYKLVECSDGGRAVVVEGLPRPRRAYGWLHEGLLGWGAELGLELGLGQGGGVVEAGMWSRRRCWRRWCGGWRRGPSGTVAGYRRGCARGSARRCERRRWGTRSRRTGRW